MSDRLSMTDVMFSVPRSADAYTNNPSLFAGNWAYAEFLQAKLIEMLIPV